MAEQRIHILSQQLANQIAAGEVIERPASVVKELLENSLDAGATQIIVEIEKGGAQLIRIIDNGYGIHPDDLGLAIARHGTSKIADFSDLERIESLGFRGEALASICSVSRMHLSSCQQFQSSGWQIAAEASKVTTEIKPVAHPIGTTISIHELFFNTPARRKFLRSEKTEFNHIEEIVKRLALSRFDLRIQLQHNQRKILTLAVAETELAKEHRLAKLCGQSFVANAIKIEVSSNDLQLSGWLSLPNYTLNQTTLQYFYVNGRIVRDKIVTHAIRQAYADLIPTGRQPAFVLFLQLDPALVDVNVHPTKHEVRFREARLVHDFVVRAVKQCLQNKELINNDLTQPEITPAKTAYQEYPLNKSQYNTQVKEQLDDYMTFIHEAKVDTPYTNELSIPRAENYSKLFGNALALVLDHFIISEKPDCLVLTNAETAQKQIVIQKFMQEYQQQNIITQPLLFPETLSFPGDKSSLALYVDLLDNLGFEIESFGPELWLLRKVPKLLGVLPWQTVFNSVLQELEEIKQCNDTLSEKIITLFAEGMAKQYKFSNELIALNQFLLEMEKNFDHIKNIKNKPWREFSKTKLNDLLCN